MHKKETNVVNLGDIMWMGSQTNCDTKSLFLKKMHG